MIEHISNFTNIIHYVQRFSPFKVRTTRRQRVYEDHVAMDCHITSATDHIKEILCGEKDLDGDSGNIIFAR